MSETHADDRPSPRPQRGGGPFGGMSLPAEKSMNFTASGKRLLGKLSPERLWLALVLGLAVISVSFSVLGPRLLGEGTNLSGGQRQRLAIARALVKRPELYIFDDSFSALDLATDARLRLALKQSTNGATMVIVAQRVSSIIDADQILVLEDGRIVGRGTHEELLDTNTTYQEIVSSQLTAEEAA